MQDLTLKITRFITEIRYADGTKKVYFMPILDHKTRLSAGWSVSKHRNTVMVLEALRSTRRTLKEVIIRLEDRFIDHGKGLVYT